jgi:hypothetical protein
MSGGGETAAGRGWSAAAGGGRGGGENTQGERIWSSLGRQKVKCGLLLIIHILWWWEMAKGDEGEGSLKGVMG